MKILEDKILKDGYVLNEYVLKVDSFLNHQVDQTLMQLIGVEFSNYFKGKNITKVVTIESSGIAPAIMTSLELNVPMIIFKKQTSSILNEDFYQVPVKSFTKNNTYNLVASKKYIQPSDNVLIIDDFLAYGEAAKGAIKLIQDANANVAGVGIVIEKSFQPGRTILDNMNIDVYSLAKISSLKKGKPEFCD